MNKKPTILAVGVLGSLALIGTGFAGWVITAEATESADGSIVAYEVTDNRVFIDSKAWEGSTAEPEYVNNRVIFGAGDALDSESSSKYPSAWLTMPDMEHEVLHLTYTITGRYTNDNLVIGATYSITDANNGYATALSNNLVTGPAVATDQAFNTTVAPVYYEVSNGADASDGKHTFTLRVHWDFGWGSHFGGANPYDFYNSKSATAIVNSEQSATFNWADDAAHALDVLKAANGATFAFTLTFRTEANAPAQGN